MTICDLVLVYLMVGIMFSLTVGFLEGHRHLGAILFDFIAWPIHALFLVVIVGWLVWDIIIGKP